MAALRSLTVCGLSVRRRFHLLRMVGVKQMVGVKSLLKA